MTTAGAERDLTERVSELQSRIHGMQRTRIDSHGLPTLPAVKGLLRGPLKAGVSYSVTGSTSLAMAMMTAASASGAWCGVVGVPSFGVEAAARWGIALDRLILIPDPSTHWLRVAATLAEVVMIVVTRPPRAATPSEVSRLGSRLRQRGATMITLGEWPQSEATLSVVDNRWYGLGEGYGSLSERQLTVRVRDRLGAPRTGRIGFPETSRAALKAVV